jgi:hypothetical protein
VDASAVVEEGAIEMTDLAILEKVPMILEEDQAEVQTEEAVTETPVTEQKKSEETPTAKDMFPEETKEKIQTSQEILIVN